jgi:PPOX class F420-dependent enzyme/OxyR family protein
MSVFTPEEIKYLNEQRLGRLATVGADGQPHVVPTSFRYNPQEDAIDIGGMGAFSKTKKYRDIRATGRAALVVDDVQPPWQPRGIEIRGQAETLETGGQEIMERFNPEIIRIVPGRIVSWGIDGEATRPNARNVR